MKEILKEINNLKEEWDMLQPVDSERSKVLWQKFRLEWNYNSNHIEGNTMTYSETELLLKLGDDFKAKNNSLKDVNEMRAHDTAIFLIKEWAKDSSYSISEKDIRELNQIILVKDFWSDAITSDGQPTRRLIKVGSYKEHPNHVVLNSGEIFKYAEPYEVSQKMQELLEWYNGQDSATDVITTAAFLHYKFVLIHPFDDGNGRVSRLLMNLHLMKHGFPPLIIKTEDKANYLYSLSQADTGNMNAFIEYLAKQMFWSLKISMKCAKGESIVEEGDLYKEIEVWKKKLKSELPTNAKRNDALSMKLHDEFLEMIYIRIDRKINTFDGLFHSKKVTKLFGVLNDRKFYSPTDKIVADYRNGGDDMLSSFKIEISYLTPLKKPNEIDLGVKLEMITKLDVLEFSIMIGSETVVVKNYDQLLEEREMDNIVEKFVSTLFSRIKLVMK